MTANPEQDPQRAEKLRQAHRHTSHLAAGLVKVFGPIDAAGVLIGAAAGILEVEGGSALAAKYLRELAADVERDDATQRGAERN